MRASVNKQVSEYNVLYFFTHVNLPVTYSTIKWQFLIRHCLDCRKWSTNIGAETMSTVQVRTVQSHLTISPNRSNPSTPVETLPVNSVFNDSGTLQRSSVIIPIQQVTIEDQVTVCDSNKL